MLNADRDTKQNRILVMILPLNLYTRLQLLVSDQNERFCNPSSQAALASFLSRGTKLAEASWIHRPQPSTITSYILVLIWPLTFLY